MKTPAEIEEAINVLMVDVLAALRDEGGFYGDRKYIRDSLKMIGALMWAAGVELPGSRDALRRFEDRLELARESLAKAAGGGR